LISYNPNIPKPEIKTGRGMIEEKLLEN